MRCIKNIYIYIPCRQKLLKKVFVLLVKSLLYQPAFLIFFILENSYENWDATPLLRFGLLYNINVIEDTVRHHEELSSCVFAESFVFVIIGAGRILPSELSSFNPIQHLPSKLPLSNAYDKFKNHLRNIKYFLPKRNLDSHSKLSSMQQPNFRKSTTFGVPSALHRGERREGGGWG